MSKLFSNLYKEFPYIGIIERWIPDRGFGFISFAECSPKYRGINRRISFFAHISHYEGPRQPRGSDFNGKHCVFATGFDPKKPERLSAIKWITEDEINGDIEAYRESRKEAINLWETDLLTSALKAEWYKKDIWRDDIPKSGLPKDQILLEAVDKKLFNSQNLVDYYSLLSAKIESPFYTFTNDEKKEELRKGLRYLVNEHPEVFQECDSKQYN